MSLQQERIAELCDSLKLSGIASQWGALAQDAAKREARFQTPSTMRISRTAPSPNAARAA